jgi:hypothetical protein
MFEWTKKLGQKHYSNGGSKTLCGKPMLGNNYARHLDESQKRECPQCSAKLKEIRKMTNREMAEYFASLPLEDDAEIKVISGRHVETLSPFIVNEDDPIDEYQGTMVIVGNVAVKR